MEKAEAGSNLNMLVVAGITVWAAVLIHFIYKIVFERKNKESVKHETESISDEGNTETSNEKATSEAKSTGKSKKRTQWKGKSEFNHPWLLKSLKGHPGTVLHADFSANGKFMAATCDESDADGARRRKQRERRRAPPAPPPPPPPVPADRLAAALRPHLLSAQRMWALGYPTEIDASSSKAVVYVSSPPAQRTLVNWDVNAPEFVPGGSPGDSGRGSLGATPPRSDSDEEADTLEHLCVRCDKLFRVTRDGEYVKDEPCLYHWGRVSSHGIYACCKASHGSRGCSTSRFHVWNGTKPGMNGPIDGFVRAKTPRGGVYAIDAEMCYTTAGLELASIAVVAADGRLVYKSLVRPTHQVVDYNTRFSGIRPRDLARATKTLRDVQNDILGFVGTDTILIGHALNNDLRALKLLHGAVVDTSAMYPHARGFPMRRSLRALCEELLGRSVQRSGSGHSPIEDARAAMDLVLLKVHEEKAKTRPALQIPVLQPYDPLVTAS